MPELEAEAYERARVAAEALHGFDLVEVELGARALVEDLDRAERLAVADDRRREERGHLVADGVRDFLEEARVLVGVGDDDDFLVLEASAGDSLPGLDLDVEPEDLARLGAARGGEI